MAPLTFRIIKLLWILKSRACEVDDRKTAFTQSRHFLLGMWEVRFPGEPCAMICSVPEEVQTFSGPQVAPVAVADYHIFLVVCAQLDLEGDGGASALRFCTSCWHRM